MVGFVSVNLCDKIFTLFICQHLSLVKQMTECVGACMYFPIGAHLSIFTVTCYLHTHTHTCTVHGVLQRTVELHLLWAASVGESFLPGRATEIHQWYAPSPSCRGGDLGQSPTNRDWLLHNCRTQRGLVIVTQCLQPCCSLGPENIKCMSQFWPPGASPCKFGTRDLHLLLH